MSRMAERATRAHQRVAAEAVAATVATVHIS
jgi:hypothetical protein